MADKKWLMSMSPVALAVTLSLAGCGSGVAVVGSDNNTGTVTPITDSNSGSDSDSGSDSGSGTSVKSLTITGGAVKGPLAFASVNLYAVDMAQADFKGELLGSGETDAEAAITGLAIPENSVPPFIIEFTATANTVDLTTGEMPVITELRSVISEDMWANKQPIYATPLTNMAVDLAIETMQSSVGPSADNGPAATFEEQLKAAANRVASTLGFGLTGEVDIFRTSPMIDEGANTEEKQGNVIALRAAVEALTAIVYRMSEESALETGDSGMNSDRMMQNLVSDLTDGLLDGESSGGNVIEGISDQAKAVWDIDPATLPIPNAKDSNGQPVRVAAIKQVIEDEKKVTGKSAVTSVMQNIEARIEVVQKNPDRDGDTYLNNQDAFPDDPAEWIDSDKDGLGNNADGDDDNDGVADADDAFPTNAAEQTDTDLDGIGNHADNDDDGDGVVDAEDDFPLDKTRQSKTDQDNDGWPSQLDANDNDASVPGIAWLDTDGDGMPDENPNGESDLDDDNDGIVDEKDAFPKDKNESQDTDEDGTGDRADTDDDGDGVPDSLDKFPLNSEETVDTDRDGKGDNIDEDDDNDGVPDLEEASGCELKRDCDGDGWADGKDAFPADADEWKDLDDDQIGDNADTDDDNDGLSDAEEKAKGTNPYLDDSDGDGAKDGEDAFARDPKEHADTDKDGVGDNSDAFPEDPEESKDSDNDGVGDKRDAFPQDPEESRDADMDGVGDNADAFDNDPTENKDSDQDGVGDNSDAFPTDPRESRDSDKDGVGDSADNCVVTPNPDQADADDNGIGDACEVTADTASLAGVWKYNMTPVSSTCEADNTTDGSDDNNGPETGFLSIAQTGADLDVLPVDAGFHLKGQVSGNAFAFTGSQTREDHFAGTSSTETATASNGVFVDVLEGNDTFSLSLNVDEGDCSSSYTLDGERVYQHSGSEDYSAIYKLEFNMDEEREYALADGTTQRNGGQRQNAFPIEIVQTGTQLDIFGGEGKFATTNIDPETGRFSVEKDSSQPREDGAVETETFKLEGLFIAAPGTQGPVLVLSENAFRTETAPTPNVGESLAPQALPDGIWSMSQERGFAYGTEATTSSFNTLVKGPLEQAVYMGLNNPPMRYSGSEASGGLRLEVLDASNKPLCSADYQGSFKEITTLDHPTEFGQFRDGPYGSISCDASAGGSVAIAAGNAYTVRVVDASGVEVYASETNAVLPAVPADLVSDVRLNGAPLPMPSGETSGGYYEQLPGFYDLKNGLNLEWTAPTDTSDLTHYQVRLQEVHNGDGTLSEVRRNTSGTSAYFSSEEFEADSGVEIQLRAVYEKANGTVHGATPAWIVRSGVNGNFDVKMATGEQLQLALYSDNWYLHSCSAYGPTSDYGCYGNGINAESREVFLMLDQAGGGSRGITLQFDSATSGRVFEGGVEAGSFTLAGTSPDAGTGTGTIDGVAPLAFEGVTVADMSAAVGEGFHWIGGWENYNSDGTMNSELEYGSIVLTSTRETVSSDYRWDFASASWMNRPKSDVLLGSNGWEIASAPETITEATASSVNVQLTGIGGAVLESFSVNAEEMDVTGKPMASALEPVWQAMVGSTLFPQGSKVFQMTMTNLDHLYELDCWDNGCEHARLQAFDSNGSYLGEDWATSLADLMATNDTDAMSKAQSLAHQSDGSDLQLVFFGDPATSTSGSAVIYKSLNDGTAPSIERNDLQWELRTVNGVEILLVNIPTDYKVEGLENPAIIFSVYNGAVVRGRYTPAGVSGTDGGGYTFNQTAAFAILEAASKSLN